MTFSEAGSVERCAFLEGFAFPSPAFCVWHNLGWRQIFMASLLYVEMMSSLPDDQHLCNTETFWRLSANSIKWT
jgi:hypothetical protein